MSAASTTILPERLEVYANSAATFGNLDGLIATISRISADQVILEREGRTIAARGARRLLAGVVRRLCATEALSEVAAIAKIDMLATVGRGYRTTDLLMAAMVDASIALEMQRWLAPPARH